MKRISTLLSHAAAYLAAAVAILQFASCSQMDTDLPECYASFQFKYDYNTQRADMFPDHVGGLTMYVFDANDRFLFQKDTANTAAAQPLKDHDFAWRFSASELPAGTYHIVTIANQKSYRETLASDGAKYRRAELQKGDNIGQLQVTLDRTADATVDHRNCPLDTLWEGIRIDTVSVNPAAHTHHTIALMRDTKQLDITLRQTVDPADMADSLYDVQITDKNGRLLCDNTPDTTDVWLRYTPWSQWTTELSTRADNDNATIVRTAHFELHFNRLISHADNLKDARLTITSRRSGEEVVSMNLPEVLADGRGAYATANYSKQEYLDREHQYNLDFYLSGDKWQYMYVRINALSWSVRKQNEVLH